MTDDGDELVTILTVAAIVGAATSLASTGYALSKGSPALPPPPVEAQADEAVGAERRKRAARFGVANTLLTSPLGGGQDLSSPSLLSGGGRPERRSLLGGG